MRKTFFLLFLVMTIRSSAQNNDYIISMDGIGAIKLGMSQPELEKLLNKKIPLTNPTDSVSGSWQDSAKINYKGMNLELDFQRNYFAPDTFNMIIIGIRTSSPLCKTKNGIGIGTDKLKIIAAYEDHFLTIEPGFVNYYYTEPSKTKSTVSILDDSRHTMIRFFLFNKKLVSFLVKTSFSDSE